MNPPLNIWNDITQCYVIRFDIVFERKRIVGIHHSDMENVISDIDRLCKDLQQYKSEMMLIYKNKPPTKVSYLKTYLYLMRDHNTGLHKIGKSIKPTLRERTLQSEKPTVSLIWISPLTDRKNEKELHRKYSHKRVRGEWFSLDTNDIQAIISYDYE